MYELHKKLLLYFTQLSFVYKFLAELAYIFYAENWLKLLWKNYIKETGDQR